MSRGAIWPTRTRSATGGFIAILPTLLLWKRGVSLRMTLSALIWKIPSMRWIQSSSIDLTLKVLPWAHFRTTKAAVKMHTQIDLRGNIPSFIHVSDGKMHEVKVLDLMTPEPGSFTIMDRGFLDFERLYRLTQAGAFFVIRPKTNTLFQRVYSRPIDKTTGLRFDQTVRLTGVKSPDDYPQYLRCVGFYDEENDKRQQLRASGFDNRAALQMSLAGRTVLAIN